MSDRFDLVSVDHLRACGWKAVIDDPDRADCRDYSDGFFEAARTATNPEAAIALKALGHVTSMTLRNDIENVQQPLGAYAVWDGQRSAVPEDFTEAELTALAEFVADVDDPEFRARIADLLWIRLRPTKIDFARMALDAYFKAATDLESVNRWPETISRIIRSIRLAKSLGKATISDFDTAVQHADSLISRTDVGAPEAFRVYHDLMKVLLDCGVGDGARYSTMAADLATHLEAGSNWTAARETWELAAKWYTRSGSEVNGITARKRAAETYERAADDALKASPPNYMVASSHLTNGMDAMRQLQEPAEAERLHKRLLGIQSLSVTQMGHIQTEGIHMASRQERSRSAVRGKPLNEAILSLATLIPPLDMEDVRNAVEEQANAAPLLHKLARTAVNEYGRVVAGRPMRNAGNAKEHDEAVLADQVEWVASLQQFCAVGGIEPARKQICSEHQTSEISFDFILDGNPLVEPDRQPIVTRGLHAGLTGDFLVASHLLIPQFEQSLRYLFLQYGWITSSLKSDGIQNEYDLNSLLYREELKEVFPEALIFEWRVAFTERWGFNLRNKVAHGLLDESGCYASEVRYATWLLLQFYCWPILGGQQPEPLADSDPDNQSDDHPEDIEAQS